MKTYNALLIAFTVAVILTGCVKDNRIVTYTANVPVYLPYSHVTNIYSTSAQNISAAGKIYLTGDYIFINEMKQGIHIVNNSNPSSPVIESFMAIPGNVDVAVKDNILYADNFKDLVALDITNLSAPTVVKRLEYQFPYSIPDYDPSYPIYEMDTTKGMIVSWEVKKVTKKCEDEEDCLENNQVPAIETNESVQVITFNSNGSFSETSSGSSGALKVRRNVGIGGSMARFTIYENYLYVARKNQLVIYDITAPANPVYVNTRTVNLWNADIETLFIYDDNLFIGSPVSVLIYSLSNPTSPVYVSNFTHVRGCDPVVVSGDFAYSTMRGDAGCGGTISELSVIDISYISSPWLRNSYSMSDPYGLGISNSMLFVCDGKSGLKIYDLANTPNLSLKYSYSSLTAFDVIPYNDVLILIGSTGLYQYDYSDPENLVELSRIPIQ